MSEEALASWRDGAAKQTIIEFVRQVSTPGPHYVSPAERVAAFDHDGTLWCEKPMYVQMAYILDNMKERIEGIPALAENPTIRGILLGNLAAVRRVSIAGFLELVSSFGPGPSPDEYEASVAQWLAYAVHPRFGVAYTQLVYQPMIELLAYLRSSGFKVAICTGGGIEFVRVIAEELYGVARECVIGTAMSYAVKERSGHLVLDRAPSLYGPANEGNGKPINIQAHIGRQPILAVGNSTGDIEMLRMAGERPLSLCLMINHDDAAREYAYEGRAATVKTTESAVTMARRRGWTVVSMKNDWQNVFAFNSS